MSMHRVSIGDVVDPLGDSLELDKLMRPLNSSSFIIPNNVANNANADVYKLIFDIQSDQIGSLTKDIEHLRKEAVSKNNTITHLLGIITTFQINGYTCNCDNILNPVASESRKGDNFESECNISMEQVPVHSSTLDITSDIELYNISDSNNSSKVHDVGNKKVAPVDFISQLQEIRNEKKDVFYRHKKNNDINTNEKHDVSGELAPWEKHSNGFGSKLMKKMGYTGGGLGKNEDGRINPISADILNENILRKNTQTVNKESKVVDRGQSNLFNDTSKPKHRVNNEVHPWPANTTLIVGSSILHGVEESRLAKYIKQKYELSLALL